MVAEDKGSRGLSKLIEKKEVADVPETQTSRPRFNFPKSQERESKQK